MELEYKEITPNTSKQLKTTGSWYNRPERLELPLQLAVRFAPIYEKLCATDPSRIHDKLGGTGKMTKF